MIILAHSITPRLQYIADFIGEAIAGQPFRITTDPGVFKQDSSARINYTDARVSENELWVLPHSLLYENSIRQVPLDVFDHNHQKAFFRTSGDFPFDIFAAAFYLLSRYEEYLPHQPDRFGRYDHMQSLAYREGFLDKPLVNTWLQELARELEKKSPAFSGRSSFFSFLPTYDIDEAYAYRHKGLLRTIGAMGKVLVKGQPGKLAERFRSWQGSRPDPFESFDWMDSFHDQFHLAPHYFFLVAANTGKYDRNILPARKAMQTLIKRHDSKYEIGIHPSWQSGDDTGLLTKEINTLQQITGKEIKTSRQHFIRFTLPVTFRRLINAGIEKDFSMGYGAINGFRASVACPFYWYDLEKEEPTRLLLHPFCFMEANSYYEQHFSPSEALEEMRHYYREIKAVNGMMITIWHNTFLGTDKMFSGWRDCYRQFVAEIS